MKEGLRLKGNRRGTREMEKWEGTTKEYIKGK